MSSHLSGNKINIELDREKCFENFNKNSGTLLKLTFCANWRQSTATEKFKNSFSEHCGEYTKFVQNYLSLISNHKLRSYICCISTKLNIMEELRK